MADHYRDDITLVRPMLSDRLAAKANLSSLGLSLSSEYICHYDEEHAPATAASQPGSQKTTHWLPSATVAVGLKTLT